MPAKPAVKEIIEQHLSAIDIGFGGSKRKSIFSGLAVMPSTVEVGNEKQSKSFKHSNIEEDKLMVETEDGIFHVGQQAMKMNPLLVSNRTIIRDRASDPAFRTLFRTNLALSVPHETGEYNVNVFTGLPNTDYDKNIRESLGEFIGKSFEITFFLGFGKKITKKINVTSFDIFRQPEGTVTFTQFEFDPTDGIIASELWKSNTGVIDIGHLTTDFGLFSDGVFLDSEGTYGSTIATSEMYKRLKQKLSRYFDQEYGIEYDPTDNELDLAVRDKVIEFNGEEHNVESVVDEAAAEIAAKIASSILNSWGQHASRVQIILLTGGGAYIFAEHLNKEFKERKVNTKFVTVEDCQMANVNGFYMLGALNMLESDEVGNITNFEDVYNKYIKPFAGESGAA